MLHSTHGRFPDDDSPARRLTPWAGLTPPSTAPTAPSETVTFPDACADGTGGDRGPAGRATCSTAARAPLPDAHPGDHAGGRPTSGSTPSARHPAKHATLCSPATSCSPHIADARKGAYGRSLLANRSASQPRRVGVPRAPPVRNIPARSPSVATAGQARSHGSGSYQVDAHGPVAGGRDSAAAAVFTTGGGRCSWRTSRNTREAQEQRERVPLLAGQRRSGSDQPRDVGIQAGLAVIVGAPVMATGLVGLVMRGQGQV